MTLIPFFRSLICPQSGEWMFIGLTWMEYSYSARPSSRKILPVMFEIFRFHFCSNTIILLMVTHHFLYILLAQLQISLKMMIIFVFYLGGIVMQK